MLSLKSDYVIPLSFAGQQYCDFDMFITNINERQLEKIGKANNIENLSAAAFPTCPFPAKGIIWSSENRFMIPLVIQCLYGHDYKPINVWFLVDTASPFTCLTVKTFEMLGKKVVSNDRSCLSRLNYRIAIQDEHNSVECGVSKDHFEEVNILGADALERLNLSIDVNWKNRTFKLIQNKKESHKKLLPSFKTFDQWLSKLCH